MNSADITNNSQTGINPLQATTTTRELCAHNAKISCASYRLNMLCLPINLDKSEIHQLDIIVERNRPYIKGDNLYRQDDIFESVYAVRFGSFKS
ncbi:MAG: hypothetical protein IIC59_06250 [Proteobacteria bacterium]|nr:hypothetical protein [Pseudomonadota bacterium]